MPDHICDRMSSEPMFTDRAVAELDALYPDPYDSDPVADHYTADNVLLRCVPIEVYEAYKRLVERYGGFWYA